MKTETTLSIVTAHISLALTIMDTVHQDFLALETAKDCVSRAELEQALVTLEERAAIVRDGGYIRYPWWRIVEITTLVGLHQ